VDIFSILQSVLGVFVLVAAGYYLCHRKILNREAGDVFAKLVTMVSIPGLLISTIYNQFSVSMLSEAALLFLVGFAAQVIIMLAAIPLARLLKIPSNRRGLFICLCAFGNYVFVGLPISSAIFGEAAAVASICFYISNIIIFWTVGLLAIAGDAGEQITWRIALKKMANPPLITFLVMTAAIILEIQLPKFILQTAGYLGGLTTPMSMLFTGIIIYDAGIKGMKLEKGVISVLIMRCVVAAAVAFVLSKALGLGSQDIKIMTLLSAMPVLSATCITAQAYGADAYYAVKNFFWTTVAGVIIIPLYAIILLSI
jgi:predicted permease